MQGVGLMLKQRRWVLRCPGTIFGGKHAQTLTTPEHRWSIEDPGQPQAPVDLLYDGGVLQSLHRFPRKEQRQARERSGERGDVGPEGAVSLTGGPLSQGVQAQSSAPELGWDLRGEGLEVSVLGTAPVPQLGGGGQPHQDRAWGHAGADPQPQPGGGAGADVQRAVHAAAPRGHPGGQQGGGAGGRRHARALSQVRLSCGMCTLEV